MAKQATARTADLEPIDRLEDKVRLLVDMVTHLRAEQAKAADENTRLHQEMAALRTRLAEAEGEAEDAVAMRDEREIIRTRVSDMLEQLEHLSL